jgi:hypothetical protein
MESRDISHDGTYLAKAFCKITCVGYKTPLPLRFFKTITSSRPTSSENAQFVQYCLLSGGGDDGTGGPNVMANEDYVRLMLDRFGHKFVELARQICEIRANALSSWEP